MAHTKLDIRSIQRVKVFSNAVVGRLTTTASLPVRRILGIALNLLLAALLAKLLYNNKDSLPLLAPLLSPWFIGLSLLLYLSAFLIQFAVWMDLMGYPGRLTRRALEDYIRTTFMGRLPGGFWKLVGRMTVYRAPGHSSKTIIIINLLELAIALLASALLLVILWPITLWLRIASGTAVIASMFVLMIQSSRLLPSNPVFRKATHWLGWWIGYVVSWLCGALIVYIIVSQFSSSLTIYDIIRYWCLASAAGLLLQILPLSTLLRDATLVALLQPHMPIARAVIAAFAIRATLTICELLIGWLLLGLIGGDGQSMSSEVEEQIYD